MKQAERTARTKAALIDAFWKLYKAKPIDQISVREITDAAGVYRSTFYLYFQDANTVLSLLEDELMDRLEAQLEEIAGKNALADVPVIVAAFYKKEGKWLCPLLAADGDHAFVERLLDLVAPNITCAGALEGDALADAIRFGFYGSVAVMNEASRKRRKAAFDDAALHATSLITGASAVAGSDAEASQPSASPAAGASADAVNIAVGDDASSGNAIDDSTVVDVLEADAAAQSEADSKQQGSEDSAAKEAEAAPIEPMQDAQADEPQPVAKPKRKRAAKPKRQAEEPEEEKQPQPSPQEDEDIQMALF